MVYFITTYLSNQNSSAQITTAEKAELEEKDTDGDGLSDWEEGLWGTDINNPDSDGDGTEDGVEVDQNRDPLDESANDRLATSSLDSSVDGYSATAQIQSKVLPQAFVLAVARDSGEEISNEDINRIASSLESEATLEPTTYNETDLNVVNNPSTDNIRSYVNRLTEILASHISDRQHNPLSVITVELQDDETQTIDLSSYISQTQKAGDQLRGMRVPSQYVAEHLAIVNSTSRTKTALEAMQQMEIDPILGITGAQMYKEATNSGEEAGERLAEKINADLQ